jgi:hypothetical protein
VTTAGSTGRLALAAAALLAAAGARAATVDALPASLALRGGRVVASIDVAAAFPPGIEHTLGNGLTNVIAVYVAVLDSDGEPVAATGRVIEILFDVWEENYSVTVRDPRTPRGDRRVLPDFAALRAFLSHERDVDVGPASAFPRAPVSVEARVEVNPISKEQLERTREFIANPTSGSRPGGSRSVLGAMAGFLLREPATGADVHLFRSRPVTIAAETAR